MNSSHKTRRIQNGIYEVIGTRFAISNDSRSAWWITEIVDGMPSLTIEQNTFINGSRNDAIEFAHRLEEIASRS